MRKLLLPLLLSISLISSPAQASDCSIPYLNAGVKNKGTINYKFIFINYPNSSKQSSKKIYKSIDLKTIEDYFFNKSNKKVKVKFSANYSWITMNKNANEYGIGPGSQNPNWRELEKAFYSEAISKADITTDFSKTDGVIFFSDPNSMQFYNAFSEPMSADGKELRAVLYSTYWDAGGLIHELMHTFGLKDLYNDPSIGHHSIMADYWTLPSPLGYEQYLLGWISNKQIMCVQDANISAKLAGKNIKLIISPLSNNSMLVIEPKSKISYIVDNSKISNLNSWG